MSVDLAGLLQERGKTHGDYGDHAGMAQALKQFMREGVKWDALRYHERETLDMIAHKIGRILAGDPRFVDHWDDIAGYAKLSANRNRPPLPTGSEEKEG